QSGIIRSSRMARGLCSRASSRACTGFPVSIVSYVSDKRILIRPRMASSSSTTRIFSISCSLRDSLSRWLGALVGADRSRPPIQCRAYLAGQCFPGKRFRKKEAPFCQDTVFANRLARVSRHVDDLSLGPLLDQLV